MVRSLRGEQYIKGLRKRVEKKRGEKRTGCGEWTGLLLSSLATKHSKNSHAKLIT